MVKKILTYRLSFLQKTLFFLGLFLALGTTTTFAQFAITEDFRGSGNPDIIIGGPGGTEGAAYLTSGVNDPLGAGWLRLTNSNTYQKGFAYVNKSFPSTMGVLVDFEYKMWRNTNDSFNGADGIGVFLFDASSSFQLGGYGGSLGYAPGGGSGTGLSGGYVGIGLDAYGNYANPTEGRVGGPGERPNAIVMRGPTTSNTGTTNRYLSGKTITTTDGINFNYLDINGNTGNRSQNALDYNTNVTSRPSDATFYRRVQIEIVRLDAAGIYYNVKVRWKTSLTGAFQDVTDYTTTDVPPALLKLGFAASSGGGVNYHEIRNLLVTTPGNLRVVKRADKDILRTNNPGNSTITYTIEVTNDTNFEISNIDFTDKITDSYGNDIAEGMSGFDITSISSSGFVSASLPTASSLTTNEVTGTLVLAANTTGTITITGRLYTLPAGSVLQNTATALPPLDDDLNNNTSIVRTPVTAENVDLILTKTVTEECISTTAPKFTVYVSNNGAVATSFNRLGTNGTRVAFYNIVPPGYTYNDSSTPGGFAGNVSDPENSNTSARWSKITLTNTPAAGYTTYGYIARGTNTSGASESLGSGLTYPYPVTYTMLPPNGTNSYTDTTTAILFTDFNYTTPIETSENQVNNNASIDMYVKPAAPAVPSGTLYYCLNEDAPELTATATGTNTLRWYMTSGGFSSEYPIKPYTGTTGSYTYYVSQVNGNCEGPTATINVVVGPTNTGTISANASTCPSGNIAITGTSISGATYRWQSSADGANWTTISGATGQNYTSGALSQTTYFRRLTTLTANGKSCEGVTNWLKVFIPSAGLVGNSQSSCNNFNPNAFTNVQDGDTGSISGITYSYQWQSSSTGTGSWSNISGATGSTYDSGNLTSTLYFRRAVRYSVGGNTCYVYSNTVVAYVGPNNTNSSPSRGSISMSPTTVCYNTIPNTINSPNDGGPGYYIWEYSTDGGSNYDLIPDADPSSSSYSPTAPITQTTVYSRRVSNGCNTSTRRTITVTVLNPTAGSIGSSQTICYNTTPSTLTSPESGTTGYRWEYADGTSGGTWQAVSGVTSATFTPPALTASRRYRRYTVSTSGGVTCESSPTNIVTITVKQQTNAGTISSSQTICNGGSIAPLTGTQATGDGTVTYLWESSANGTSGWTAAGGTNNQQNYTPSGSSTIYYRRVAKVSGCADVYSNIVSIIFSVVPTAGSIGSDQTICNGAVPSTLTSATDGTGTGTITYAWQSSTDSGNTWSADIPGATGATYTPGALTTTTQFKRFTVATNGTAICRSARTNVITVTVSPVATAGTIGNNQTVCSGNVPPQTVDVTPGTNASGGYIWQISTNNSTWTDIAGATNPVYQPTAPITVTTYYRRLGVSNTGGVLCRGTVPSNVITMTVPTVPTAGTIGSDQNVCGNTAPALLTSVVDGTGGTSYQWQLSYGGNPGDYWENIAGATASTYQPAALSTVYYRRLTINGTCPSAPSNVVKMTVSVYPNPGSIGSSQSICGGTTPADLVSNDGGWAGGPAPVYRWEVSTDNNTWTNTGVTTAGYTFSGPLPATRYYRRALISSLCSGDVYSNVITITVGGSLPTAGSIGTNQTICNGATPAPLTSLSAGSGSTYRWEVSTDNSTWTSTGVTTAGYSPGALTTTTYYRRASVTGSCESYTSSVTITVQGITQPGTITAGSTQTICNGDTPAALTSAAAGSNTSGGTITYRWEVSSTGTGGWTTATGTSNGASYSPGALTATTYYRRIAISTLNGKACESAPTANVVVTVQGITQPGTITAGSTQTICNGDTPATLTSATSGSNTSGGTITYRWEVSSTGTGGWATATGTSNGASYSPGALTATTYYRRIAISTLNGNGCESVPTANVVVTVQGITQPGAITAGSTQTICNGDTPATLTSATAGSNTSGGTITYRWEVSSTGTGGWTTATGTSNGASYSPGALTATTYYRRIAISTLNGKACESAPTANVVVTVQGITQPGTITAVSTQTICNGDTPATLTSATSGSNTSGGTITYRWEVSSTGTGGWTTATGTSNGASYSPGALTATTYYRRIAISTLNGKACESAPTANVVITVAASPTAGAIAANQNICNGSTPAGLTSTTAGTTGGSGTLGYKWQFSINGGGAWTDISGASGATYQPGSLTVTTMFRRITTATNGSVICESVPTSPVTITVSDVTTAGSIGGTQTICMDTAPAILGSITTNLGTGSGTITYRWESSVNGTTGWTTIAGATSGAYQPPVLHSTMYYRRITIATSTVSGNTATCESVPTTVAAVTTKNCKVITNPMIYQRVKAN
ncbi:hypothetical protein [Flavobacterium sp. NRK1]|uniref:hypothetical protein n=1 Tax=Flavobacterium sp. NRK1 TaxID=2954929 RepID=UPI002093F811|nr:hypothetical protein [Flavobacterium sp. NRK1]MCO6148360.1 hypothetical protein [Flavobacterium sp. NRK1]